MPSALNQAKLEDRRRHLIRFIEEYHPQGSANNRVTIVFDGHADIHGGMRSPAMKVIFSQGGSADDLIRKTIAQAKNTKEFVVVSDDRDIQYAVRALGAKTAGSKAFLNKARIFSRGHDRDIRRGSGKKSAKSRSGDQGKYIPKTDEMRITSEFQKIWVDREKKNGKP